jgi:hypothetical protein
VAPMILNHKSWELVKEGNFIVGDRELFNNGVAFRPGEDFPKQDIRKLFELYELNLITEKPERKKTRKQKCL